MSDSNQSDLNPIFDFRNITDIKNDTELRNKKIQETKINKGLLKAMPANQWIELAKIRPIPRMIFGEFWYEGELCILFADTNLGKSILAVQIGNSISRREQIEGFRLEADKQPILYCDFELSDKQFENRYSVNYDAHYTFDDNFIRVEIDPNAIIPDTLSFEEYLYVSLERTINETRAKILIIDNLTYLKNETEKAKDALPLMKHLKALKTKFGLSILALAHTPKRDLSKPITRNDLQGSKMLINFCDSCFTIGESQKDTNIRYLKQIKVRQKEFIYDNENVCVCQIEKPHNFLKFGLINFSSEREHLKEISEKDKEHKILEVKELSKECKTQRQISNILGISLGMVNKYIKM